MNDLTVPAPRKLWARLLLMVLLAAAFQLARLGAVLPGCRACA